MYSRDDKALPLKKFPTDGMLPKERVEYKVKERGYEVPFVPPRAPKTGLDGCVRVLPFAAAVCALMHGVCLSCVQHDQRFPCCGA